MGDWLRHRATHASHRATLRCLGLSVGIAIALSGCDPVDFGAKCDEQRAQWIADDADCQARLSPTFRSPDGAWHDKAIAACNDASFYTSYSACDHKTPAQGIETRSAKTEGLGPKDESPVAESDAPNNHPGIEEEGR